MKIRRFFSKCERENCNNVAYAYGLCYTHYIESLNDESTKEKKKGTFFLVAASLVTSVILVLLFAAAVLFSVECVIYCSRYGGNDRLLLYIVTALVALIVLMILMKLLLMLSDRSTVMKILICLLLTGAVVFAAVCFDVIFSNAAEYVKTVARTVVEYLEKLI